jgi:hypothetical protein
MNKNGIHKLEIRRVNRSTSETANNQENDKYMCCERDRDLEL